MKNGECTSTQDEMPSMDAVASETQQRSGTGQRSDADDAGAGASGGAYWPSAVLTSPDFSNDWHPEMSVMFLCTSSALRLATFCSLLSTDRFAMAPALLPNFLPIPALTQKSKD